MATHPGIDWGLVSDSYPLQINFELDLLKKADELIRLLIDHVSL